MEIKDISWFNLFTGYFLLVIPVGIMWYYKTGLIRDTFISVLRMTVQLFLMGLYLTVLFDLNSAFINILWVLVMIGVSTFTVIKRSELNWRFYAFPVAAGILISLVIVDSYFLGLTIGLENFFDPRYFITITGMILGNTMERNIISLNEFYTTLRKNRADYKYCLANGASRQEALLPFMRQAIKKSFNPQIARMAVLGLIALPGMMTGQIIGGSSPEIAIKYQILLMLSIFIAGMIAVIVTINIANCFLFDEYDNFKITN